MRFTTEDKHVIKWQLVKSMEQSTSARCFLPQGELLNGIKWLTLIYLNCPLVMITSHCLHRHLKLQTAKICARYHHVPHVIQQLGFNYTFLQIQTTVNFTLINILSYQWGLGIDQPHRPRPPVGSIRPSPERLQCVLGAWTREGLYYDPRRPWPL